MIKENLEELKNNILFQELNRTNIQLKLIKKIIIVILDKKLSLLMKYDFKIKMHKS